MKTLKILGIILLIGLVIIQFIPVSKNIDTRPQPNAIGKLYEVPQDVKVLLEAACNDCHSNNTKYPWYSKIQPVAWYLKDHVDEGKRALNFDEFGAYPAKKQAKKLEDISEVIQQGEMPLTSYTLIHQDAKLSPAQKTMLVNWANNLKLKVGNQAGVNVEAENEEH